MNCKKYRICLMLLVLALLAGTAFYYMTNEKEAGEPKKRLDEVEEEKRLILAALQRYEGKGTDRLA